MTDYFSEYSSFVGAKGLPSPADTPYETPNFPRSIRSSRITASSSREVSASPPPLPPDTTEYQEKARDGRYTALDPRRFTPTLHASLVSEILNLRRELDSKNNLVENLETSLSTAKTENDDLTEKLSEHAKEVRKAKLQTQQLEKGTYEAVEELAKERDLAMRNLDELRSRLDVAQKTSKQQDEDAERTQQIWEAEKERWDNERRQLERRVHVTETRLRTVVDEMTAHQHALDSQKSPAEDVDESMFKDSGLGNESDTGSVQSATPRRHRRNVSSLSFRSRNLRNSTASRTAGTPEPHAKPNGYSLADELGIDEEDEYDMDEFEHPDEELEFAEKLRRTMESRQSSVIGEDSKAKRILGLTTENVDAPASPTFKEPPKRSIESVNHSDPTAKRSSEQPASLPAVSEIKMARTVRYVDTGYQPSPPPSPPHKKDPSDDETALHGPRIAIETEADNQGVQRSVSPTSIRLGSSPISPPETPVVDGKTWPEDKSVPLPPTSYSTASTQTDFAEEDRPKNVHLKRDSLSPPSFVPAIAIHPPTSRPSTPKPYVLPPGTKNASTQANLVWRSRDASVQTEEIRVDKRPVKLPQHLLPAYLLPSPTFQEPPKPVKRPVGTGTAKIFSKPFAAPPALPSPPPQSPQESSPEMSRDNSQKDPRSMPLRAIPLPKPTLAPPGGIGEPLSEGPLNRSAQYGVTRSAQRGSHLLDMDKASDISDTEDIGSDIDTRDLENSIYALNRPPHGRFGLSEPPKAVPEDKEISPERRPDTAGSYGAAPAPSVASSRANSQNTRPKPAGKRAMYKDFRSRSPSFASMASSVYSTQSAVPPFPIPTRSSSRVVPVSHSEGSQSPTQHHYDIFGTQSRSHQTRQASLRKVQSAAVMRGSGRRGSPQKSRRRRRHSPDLTPVQSMAFESPAPTKFPIPELPTPLQDHGSFDYIKGSVDLSNVAPTVATTPRMSEETNLVDAIAGTMVGEWMWKYIRKRKSFGVQEDFPIAEDGTVNISGSRHKRWVWLSPYERTIMWDQKQPATNNALLGKKGRKCKSVIVLSSRSIC